MNPHRTLSRLTNRRPAAVLLCVLAAACMATGVAHALQEGEREFKSTVSEHVPVKVKVKNEQRFKDVKNKGWARELEIEVKNTGSKPIYYLFVVLSMPDFLSYDGNRVAFLVAYGRKELGYIDTPVEPEDVPILPGESVTLKVNDDQVKGFESFRKERGGDPKKLELVMQIINFGDGTGLRGADGRPYLPKKQTSEAGRPRAEASGCEPRPTARGADTPVNLLKAFDAATPASFLRANFFPAARRLSAAPAAPSRDLCNCQNSNECVWVKIGCPRVAPATALVRSSGCFLRTVVPTRKGNA